MKGVDAKSEFAYEGEKLGQRALTEKKKKICTTVKQLYLFIRQHITFQAKFCMLQVIDKMFYNLMFICRL